MRPVAALTIALPALLLAAPAGAAAATGDVSAVTIAVSDGVEQAGLGEVLSYTVIVENSGAETFTGSVNLRAPDFVEVAASAATVEAGTATWTVEVPAGESAQFEAEATVGDEPGNAYQVVMLAELADADGTTLVRAADADAIPGAQAPPAVPGLTDQAEGIPEWVLPVAFVAAAVLAGSSLAIFGALLARRRRPARG